MPWYQQPDQSAELSFFAEVQLRQTPESSPMVPLVWFPDLASRQDGKIVAMEFVTTPRRRQRVSRRRPGERRE